MRKLSICTIIRNEGPYLREWIEFHRLVGVEHFYVYDHQSTDESVAVLAQYVRDGLVTVVDWPHPAPTQTVAYTDCAHRFGQESQWIAFMDADEFFYAPDKRDLREVLAEYAQYGGVHVNYVNYGTSGLEERGDDPVIQRFLRRARHDAAVKLPAGLKAHGLDPNDVGNYHALNARVSSVIQPARVVRCGHPHYWDYREGWHAVTENHERHTGPITASVSVSKLRMNHYWSKSVEECREKFARGEVALLAPRTWPDEFLRRNVVLNDVADGEILAYLPALRNALGLASAPSAEELLAENQRRWNKQRADRYFIKEGYQIHERPQYFHDGRDDVVWQAAVYARAAELARRFGARTIIDIGCGTGDKIAALASEFEIVGVDFGSNVERARLAHPRGRWIEHDLQGGEPLLLPADLVRGAVVVSADVIEHLPQPERLLHLLARLRESAAAIVISTPDRDATRGDDDFGPPKNPCHVREWATAELAEFLRSAGFDGATFELVPANDRDLRPRTIMASLVMARLNAETPTLSVQPVAHDRLQAYAGRLANMISEIRRDGIQEIVLYGVGEAGQTFISFCRAGNIRVRCAVDKQESLWGTEVDGVRIVPLTEAFKERVDAYAIASFSSAREISRGIRAVYPQATRLRIYAPTQDSRNR
ncbi:MAG TPA: glycosyltransferase family 92 protein [Terriglobia bacterium]|nr:glycosyltransferase family 92 protein [Terriglobia bacterium]